MRTYDTTTVNGGLIFGIFAALAEFKRELISGRTYRVLVASASDLPEESHQRVERAAPLPRVSSCCQ